MTNDDNERDKWAIGWIALAVALVIIGTVLLTRR